MAEQKEIIIGDVKVPVIIEDGTTYYPISYLSEKVLLRQDFISKSQARGEYSYGIKWFIIKYSENNVQNVKCVSEECLKHRLNNTQAARLRKDQKESQNKLHNYLGINEMDIHENLIIEMSTDDLKKHDDYTIKIINEFIKNNKVKYQICNKCEKYFPMDNKFFRPDIRIKTGYSAICMICEGYVDFWRSDDKEINKIKKAGEDLYKAFTEDNLIKIYKACLEDTIDFLPHSYSNKEGYLEIIRWLIDEKILNVKELNIKNLCNNYKLIDIKKHFTINQLHIELFGEDCVYHLWKYQHIQSPKLHDHKYARIIMDNYLKENGIMINDKFIFDYGAHVLKARIRTNDLLGFVVSYNEYSDAGYKYKSKATNYYKNEENILFDLKYLIEQDMQLEINKIPLYLTKTSLRRNADPLYNFIVVKGNGSLYEWVNKLYPDQFNELDFDINYYREVFDSIEEGQIHELLISELRSVIYNGKIDGRRLFILGGMEPDWIVIKDDSCWVIEYFGMYSDRGAYNTRTDDYVKKTKVKFENYEKLDYYGKIYLYPEDLKNNFEGVKSKIEILK